jgi:uncharacterized membrane protein
MEDSRRDDQKETGRVETFSDGVIAIAITLLILEIKIPKPDEIASVSLFIKLLDLWPSFLAFVTSFATILVVWVNHHRVFRLVRTTDYPFLYWNGFLLLTISFVPFPTALLAGHLTSPEAATATAVYAGTNVVMPWRSAECGGTYESIRAFCSPRPILTSSREFHASTASALCFT